MISIHCKWCHFIFMPSLSILIWHFKFNNSEQLNSVLCLGKEININIKDKMQFPEKRQNTKSRLSGFFPRKQCRCVHLSDTDYRPPAFCHEYIFNLKIDTLPFLFSQNQLPWPFKNDFFVIFPSRCLLVPNKCMLSNAWPLS